MPINFGKPVTTDLYTGVLQTIRENESALAALLDPAYAGTVTGAVTGHKRYSSGALQEYNGSSWANIPINGVRFDGTNTGVGGAPSTKLHVHGTFRIQRDIEPLQYHQFENTGSINAWTVYNTVAAAKPLQINVTTDGSNTAPTGGSISFGVRILNTEKFTTNLVGTRFGGGVATGYEMELNATVAHFWMNGTGTNGPAFRFATSGTERAYIGVAAGANNFVTGDAIGDMTLRTQNHSIRFSVNGGTSSAMIITPTHIRNNWLLSLIEGGGASPGGLIGVANTTDFFTYETGKAVHHYGLQWMSTSWSSASGAAAMLSGYGGISMITQGTERVRISSNGGISFISPLVQMLRIAPAGPESLRMAFSGAFLCGYNTAETIRSGYLQFNDTNVVLASETGHLGFLTGGVERGRFLPLSMTFLVGTTASNYALSGRGSIEVAGTSTAILAARGASHATYLYDDGTNSQLFCSGGDINLTINGGGFFNLQGGGPGRLKMNGHITRFVSLEQAIPASGNSVVSVNHTGSRIPDLIQVYARCINPEHGYSSGNEVLLTNDISVTNREYKIWADDSSIFWQFIGAVSTIVIRHATTLATASLTAANWRIVIKAYWL